MPFIIDAFRVHIRNMTPDEKDLVLLGISSCSLNANETTLSRKKRHRERTQDWMTTLGLVECLRMNSSNFYLVILLYCAALFWSVFTPSYNYVSFFLVTGYMYI